MENSQPGSLGIASYPYLWNDIVVFMFNSKHVLLFYENNFNKNMYGKF